MPASQLLPPPPARKLGLSASQSANAFTRGPKADFAIEHFAAAPPLPSGCASDRARAEIARFSASSSDMAGRVLSASTSAGSHFVSVETPMAAMLNCARARARLFCARISSCLPRRQPYLGAQGIGFHGHAALEAILAAFENRLGGLHGLARQPPAAFSRAGRVIGIHHAKDDFLVGAFQFAAGGLGCARRGPRRASWRRNRKDSRCRRSAWRNCRRASGVFSAFSAKSAAVNRCCRSLLPKTYTGSFPRVAVSENAAWGRSDDRGGFDVRQAGSRIG